MKMYKTMFNRLIVDISTKEKENQEIELGQIALQNLKNIVDEKARKGQDKVERIYTNGEIYDIAVNLFRDYEVFKKSQEEAEKILAQHRLVIMTSFRHQTALKKIKEELKKRGISYPRQEEIEISIEEIIKRVEENKKLEIMYIKEYKETWHGYIGKDNWDQNHMHAEKGYETRIREISLAYNNIIETLKNKQEQRLKREK